jgi:hypothetical protein
MNNICKLLTVMTVLGSLGANAMEGGEFVENAIASTEKGAIRNLLDITNFGEGVAFDQAIRCVLAKQDSNWMDEGERLAAVCLITHVAKQEECDPRVILDAIEQQAVQNPEQYPILLGGLNGSTGTSFHELLQVNGAPRLPPEEAIKSVLRGATRDLLMAMDMGTGVSVDDVVQCVLAKRDSNWESKEECTATAHLILRVAEKEETTPMNIVDVIRQQLVQNLQQSPRLRDCLDGSLAFSRRIQHEIARKESGFGDEPKAEADRADEAARVAPRPGSEEHLQMIRNDFKDLNNIRKELEDPDSPTKDPIRFRNAVWLGMQCKDADIRRLAVEAVPKTDCARQVSWKNMVKKVLKELDDSQAK